MIVTNLSYLKIPYQKSSILLNFCVALNFENLTFLAVSPIIIGMRLKSRFTERFLKRFKNVV